MMAVPVPFTGGCGCGAIRYECSAEPLLIWKCHCHACQRFTGSAFFVTVAVPATAFSFTKGELKYHTVKGENGGTLYRGFCSSCGSIVGSKAEEFPDMRFITAGSADDPSVLEPQADIWTSSAQPWDDMNPALPKYERMPTDEQIQELMEARRRG